MAQWAGNGVLSYFLPAVLTTSGYTASVTQANINLGYACFQFAFALTGAALVDRIGRRPLMLFSMTGCCIVWIGMTIATALYNQDNTNTSAAKASIAIGWKTYIIFIVQDAIQAGIFYFFMPETKNRTVSPRLSVVLWVSKLTGWCYSSRNSMLYSLRRIRSRSR